MIAPIVTIVLLLQVVVVQGCGGFFCSLQQPVVQSGEQIIFSVDGGKINMHIFIAYAGETENFSWVLPLPTIPNLSVGSNEAFRRLRSLTKPQFVVNWADNNGCNPTSGQQCEFADGATQTTGGGGGGVTILEEGSVGPFEFQLIQADAGSTGAEVQTWLTTNGYDQPASTSTLLQHYVSMNHVFLGLKLQNDKSANDIQPIVLKYDYGQDITAIPCVPLQLTQIAAQEDMPIQIWVFGNARAVPLSFWSVEIDETKYPWFECGTQPNPWIFGGFFTDFESPCDRIYREMVTDAINEVGGHGFVTDVAIPTSEVQFYPNPLNLTSLNTFASGNQQAGPYLRELLNVMRSAGYNTQDPLLQQIIRTWIPLPTENQANVPGECRTEQFYYNPSNLESLCSSHIPITFNPQGMTADVNERIKVPLEKVTTMAATYPKLTKLSCFIDPVSMTADPVLTLNADAPDVPIERRASGSATCSSDNQGNPERITAAEITTPDGTLLSFNNLDIPLNDCGIAFGDASSFQVPPGTSLGTATVFAPDGTSSAQIDFTVAGLAATRQTMETNAMSVMPAVTQHVVPPEGIGGFGAAATPSAPTQAVTPSTNTPTSSTVPSATPSGGSIPSPVTLSAACSSVPGMALLFLAMSVYCLCGL